jgi:hypothetical protein
MSLQGYYNRFSASDKYDELLFRASKGLQSAELNESQSILSDRITKIANSLFQDGAIISGGAATVDPATGAVTLLGGSLYVLGAVREVASAQFNIPTTGGLQLGVRLTTSTVTELEDASLRDPAQGTRNYQEPGAGRTKRELAWGWSGDGGTGDFYGVYDVLNGALVTVEPPPVLDAAKKLVAQYDRDANGSYIVSGLTTTSLNKDATNSNYVFTVAEGVANVWGSKIDKPTATGLSYPIDPDLQTINNEPKVSAGPTSQTLTVNRFPLATINDVVITKEVTVTLTHGSFSGALDQLPDTSVLSIQSVSQGATTYSAGTDFNLTADQVDWSPSGAEPAPGSTYSVTYRFLTSISATNIDPDTGDFDIVDAVASTLVLVDYSWKMPRIDVISLDSYGYFHRVRGVSTAFNPVAPTVPYNELQVAEYFQNWNSVNKPQVENNGVKVVSVREQRQMKKAIAELYGLVAAERLERDISSREPTAKYGVFADPLLDSDLRDAGVSQDAVIVSQELQLAVSGAPVRAAQNNDTHALLPYQDVELVSQTLFTGFMAVNPYGNFDAVPADVTLDPAVDLWVITEENTTFSTESFTIGSGDRSRSSTATVVELASEVETNIANLRQTVVDFDIKGFDAGETLTSITFDGQNLGNNGEVADSNGDVAGTFTVPADIPSGSKEVEFLGNQGNFGSAIYTGQGTLVQREWNSITTTTTWRWWSPPPPRRNWDPLAQSFVLPEGRHITALDLQFAIKGSDDNDVTIDIVEGDNGFPGRQPITRTRIKGSDISPTGFTTATFDFPIYLEAGQEYFIVLMTDDASHAVRIAELGKYDAVAGEFVTAQPYTVGVLLSSSNASSWTVHNDMDLCFVLKGAEFTATQSTINLGSLTVSNMTDLLVTAPVDIPATSSRVTFKYTRSNGEEFLLAPDQSIKLEAAVSDTMQVQAILSGSSTESPTLHPGVLSLPATLDTAGTYVGREFDVANGGSTIRIIFEAQLAGGAGVVPQYDNGGFQSMALASATPIGDGFVEYVFEDTGIVALSATRVKLNLTGSAAGRPKVRNIRAVMV